MQNKLIALISILILTIIGACQENAFNDQFLKGSWKIHTWKIESSTELITGKMDMTFEQDGLYQIDYGSEKENGKYWVSGDYLHTVENQKSEKKVKILSLSQDTFSIQMNRSGRIENVVLVKK